MKTIANSLRNLFVAILLISICCAFLAGCTANTQDMESTSEEILATENTGPNQQTIPTIEMSGTLPSNQDDSTSPSTGVYPTEGIHIHSYSGKVTDPKCTEKGYTTFSCTCGDTYQGEFVEATGHSYHAETVVASCSENGYVTYSCKACSHTYSEKKGDATGHSWGSWKVTKEATVSSEGAEQRICTNCGQKESRSIEKLPLETSPKYETFSGVIGEYNAHNLAYKDWKGDTEQAAFIEVYVVEKNDSVLKDLSAEFEKVYGFAPSLGDKYRASSSCEKVGTFIVQGYSDPKTVYHYTITDKTYIYITNPMYQVYTQTADDGSVWVGYCIYATMDTLGNERNKPEVQALDQEMYATFEKLIGLSRSEMNSYKDELDLRIGYISEAGTVRSAHKGGLVNVLFIYCRGFVFNSDPS